MASTAPTGYFIVPGLLFKVLAPMIPALFATVLFSISVVAANRSTRSLGAHTANFGRIFTATALLALWAHLFGGGAHGRAFWVFFVSGCVGFGLGDLALFQTLPRLGPRLSSLLINCLAAPFAALIEWQWLATNLSAAQVAWGMLILVGVGFALAPEDHVAIPSRRRWAGILFGVGAGLGQGLGAVISRKAYAVAASAGQSVDGATAAYQRILGGLAIISVPYLWETLRERWAGRSEPRSVSVSGARATAWRWVLVNGLAGPTLGVACYQWALRDTPSGIVLPVVATSPLVVIPFTYFMDGDRPSARSLMGGVVAVAGVAGLMLAR